MMHAKINPPSLNIVHETEDNANKIIRKNLSDAYQILAYLGLDDHTYTHLSARSNEGDSFFIHPFGLRYEEVTPDNLMKVSFDGTILEGTEFQYNQTGYMIHGVLYQGRPDLNAIFHTHTPENVVVSSLEEGLLPLSQWALHFYERISYHTYNSLVLDASHKERLMKDLGQNFTMFLRHHGALTMGRTIHEAMFYTYHLELACKTQCLALAQNKELIEISHDICVKASNDLLGFEQDLGLRDWAAWIRMINESNN
jgi:ribulose-5-phosphate 4-epimerase/fuculose-1-phosphate aldolase